MPGETLWRICQAYGVDLEEVIAVNNLDNSARIEAGRTLLIPNPHRTPPQGPLLPPDKLASTPREDPTEEAEDPGKEEEAGEARESVEAEEPEEADKEKEASRRSPVGERAALAAMRWPSGGAVQSRFGPRGRRHHDGIDIDGRRGDPIRAAAEGKVIFRGTRGSYGKTLVLDHGDGVRTLYAHAEDFSVRRGERVKAGQKIGRIGRTGNASGSHLHFEIQVDRRAVDPLPHLPLRTARAGDAR